MMSWSVLHQKDEKYQPKTSPWSRYWYIGHLIVIDSKWLSNFADSFISTLAYNTWVYSFCLITIECGKLDTLPYREVWTHHQRLNEKISSLRGLGNNSMENSSFKNFRKTIARGRVKHVDVKSKVDRKNDDILLKIWNDSKPKWWQGLMQN
jgi:hypothetical protein